MNNNPPGLYVNIGKKARDLLYQGYAQQPPIHFHYGFFDCNFDIACQVKDIVPGFNSVFGFVVPDSGKVELQYRHLYGGVTGGFGIRANNSGGYSPVMKVSGIAGNDRFSLGTDLSFDIARKAFSCCNAGLSFSFQSFIASLIMNENLDKVSASCYHLLIPSTDTSVAAEVKHCFSGKETTLSIGAQHSVLPSTMVKGRVNSQGKASVVFEQSLWAKLLIRVSGEVDVLDIKRIPRMGVSIGLRPLFNKRITNPPKHHTSIFMGCKITTIDNCRLSGET